MRTVICGLGVLALAIAGLSVATLYGDTTPSVQAAGITLGVDVTTDGNDASHLGTIDNCKRVEVGNDFDIDVYITDVTGLQAWDAFFAFDGSLLTLTGQQEMMIAGFAASDPVPDSGPHKHFLGYGKVPPSVDGSGRACPSDVPRQRARCQHGQHLVQPTWPAPQPRLRPDRVRRTDLPGQHRHRPGLPEHARRDDSPQPTATPSPTPAPTPTPRRRDAHGPTSPHCSNASTHTGAFDPG